MKNWLAYGGLAVGIGIWLHTLWRARTSIITTKDEVDQNLAAVFFVYMGVAMFGFNFPLVAYGGSAVIGTTRALLWISLVSAPFCSVTLALYLRRFEWYSAVWMGILTFFLFFIFNGCYVALFNGLADVKPAQKRVARIMDKQFFRGSGKSGPSYTLWLRDWADPQKRVRLQTGSSFYQHSAIGDAIELQIKPGALGMEWIQDARRATF